MSLTGKLCRICIVLLALVLILFCAQHALAGAVYRSPLALVAASDGGRLFVAEATATQVTEFDLSSRKVIRAYRVSGPPGGLALSPDEAFLYVTRAVPEGEVNVIDLKTGKVDHRIHVGHTPGATVVSPDGKLLFVCNRFSNDLSVVDLHARRVTAVLPAIREPVAAALTSEGRLLLAANLLPVGRADTDYVAAAVTVIDAEARKTIDPIMLPNGSTGLRGLCISPDDRYAYVTHILARYHLPTTQLERGWINTNAVSVIDLAARSLVNTVLIDDPDAGAANPWGAACTKDGKYLCIAHAGTHEVSVIDRAGLHDKLARVAAGEQVTEVSSSPERVPDDLAFLGTLRKRIRLQGNGPRGLVVSGNRIYLAEYFSDSIGEVYLDAEGVPAARSHPLGAGSPMSTVRRGEMLFHDATMCFQHWQSCASCHPGGGRVDGLNWDLLNDGIGNPKNTKSLLLAYQTPPAMATGVRKRAQAAVRAGIKHIHLMVRPREDAVAIDAYLESLKPVPSPFLVRGELSKAAADGREVFARAGCTECHPPPLYTDLNRYDVGTGQGLDQGRQLDTPTLIELWRTAPYLYDGRAATMREVLTRFNREDKHGRTAGLTEDELSDLEFFLLSH